ncbi:MAG: winged helix-turn-helix domain-containing tetratricopeptide repeat protein [Wenzhouxiangella sp.]
MSSVDRDNPGLHAFGPWRFDAGTGDLSDGETTTRLEPQVAKLLDYFLVHQDTLISRDELIAAVWDNRIVSDDAINRCISILRQALSPNDRNAYIETVVRRGFISHFPPAPPGAAPAPEPEPGTPRPRRRSWMLATFAGVAALILFGVFLMPGDSPPPVRTAERSGVPTVAVLPFISAGLAGDSEFFAAGMHDDLLTQLAQLQSMQVISRTYVYEYRDTKRNIREIGRELGADAILEGGVQRVGDQIRVNVQLIDAHTDVHLWAQQYDRELTPANIFHIQAEIARSIASAMDATLTPEDATQLAVLPTQNMAAYRASHEAMELRLAETIGAPAYIAALERAVNLDPEFVRAWAELAGSLSYYNIRRWDPESIQHLETILERIRALAPQSSEYLIAQAYYTYYVLKDYARAHELIQQARSLRPSDVHVLELQSWIQRRLGDYDGLVDTRRRAGTLDPRNPHWRISLVSGLIVAHRYDEAIEELENSPFENFDLAVQRSMLRVRDHREPGRRLEDLLALQQEYGERAGPSELWDAHIAARDYAGAGALLEALQAAEPSADGWGFPAAHDIDVAWSITDHFLDTQGPLDPRLAEARARLERQRDPGVDSVETNFHLPMAFIAAVEGDTAETERRVRSWLREAGRDLAELSVMRHHACRALGLAAAASATVECLRDGLAEPSLVMPFIEPFLPYYDAVREDSAFVEFLAGIEAN